MEFVIIKSLHPKAAGIKLVDGVYLASRIPDSEVGNSALPIAYAIRDLFPVLRCDNLIIITCLVSH